MFLFIALETSDLGQIITNKSDINNKDFKVTLTLIII